MIFLDDFRDYDPKNVGDHPEGEIGEKEDPEKWDRAVSHSVSFASRVCRTGKKLDPWKTESIPNEVSDLIMSLILVSAVEIATNPSLPQKINSDIVNELDKRYEISKIYLEYHK